MNLFISSFRFNKPVTLLYRAVLPFIALLMLALIATTYIPSLSIWLTGFIETEEMPSMEQIPLGRGTTNMCRSRGTRSISMTSWATTTDFGLDDLEGDLDGDDGLSLDDLEGDLGDDFGLDDLEGDLDGEADDDDEITLDDLEDEL